MALKSFVVTVDFNMVENPETKDKDGNPVTMEEKMVASLKQRLAEAVPATKGRNTLNLISVEEG